MRADAPALRQVAVARLTLQEELANVFRSAVSIIVLVWIYLAATLGDGTDARRALLPYQALIQTRPTVDQRMFRELQEGLLEAEAMRSTDGAWPTPETLAANGIPPFADDPTVKGARYRWSLRRSGTALNYVGTPDQPTAPTWLLLVQEPEPGVPPDQAYDDEEHHTLLDGSMLHVGTWSRSAGPALTDRVVVAPHIEGWQQLYAVGPSANPVVIMPR